MAEGVLLMLAGMRPCYMVHVSRDEGDKGGTDYNTRIEEKEI
jgi:hypothetical protein